MNQETLQAYVEKISLEFFQKPFLHQAFINTRLRTTGGRYHVATHNLDFNIKIYEEHGEAAFSGIVKHELCHYHLHLAGKGYKHRDRDFKKLLKKVGGLRYTPSLRENTEAIKIWEYQCTGCGETIYRKRRFNVNRYICSKCASKFKLVDRKMINSEGSLKREMIEFERLLARMPKPAQRALKAENIESIEELYKRGKTNLLNLHGLGPETIKRIEEFTEEML